jgi:hypothetical protein
LGSGPVGVGLRGMRERVLQLGGTLHIDSEDRGTTIRAMFPIAKAAAVSPQELPEGLWTGHSFVKHSLAQTERHRAARGSGREWQLHLPSWYDFPNIFLEEGSGVLVDKFGVFFAAHNETGLKRQSRIG